MTKLICKHCKVEVVSRSNTSAILGKEHKKCCPRSRPTNHNYRKVK